MPYVDEHLPFNGSTPLSRHTSRAGAEDARSRALSQAIRYLRALKDHPHGLTDLEAADLLGVERTSINARRRELVKAGLVYADGTTRPGPTGVRNVAWKSM